MSGGHFDYKQYEITNIADEVQSLIKKNELGELYTCYSLEVIAKFEEGLLALRKAEVYAQRIDWLVSCDDGEDTFLTRLRDDLNAIE
jgi:hypothetical protein